MNVFHLPDTFVQSITDLYGAHGIAWLNAFPDHLAGCAARWGLEFGPPYALAYRFSYNYVAPVQHADGSPAVLKLGVPEGELLHEMAALRAYDGRGAVRLLDADAKIGALLLERLTPGTPLATLTPDDDDTATTHAAHVMTTLWRTPPDDHAFPTVAQWAAGLQRLRLRYAGGTGPMPRALVERAESLFHELLDNTEPSYLLHGDLHHENILAAERAPYLAIDPKGVIGEAAYETAAFLRNPIPDIGTWPDLRHLLARRVDILAEQLGLDHRRIIGYGLAHAVLSAWWSLEDHGTPDPLALRIAATFAEF
jgi:streptomycin 6-kinase